VDEWTQAAPAVSHALAGRISMKTASLAQMEASVQQRLQTFLPVHRFYSEGRFPQLRFTTWRRDQHAMDTLCRKAAAAAIPKERRVGAFGSAEFASRGFPRKRLLQTLPRHATLVMIDEYNTSARCSHCLAPLHSE
jgi:hypothetical protein